MKVTKWAIEYRERKEEREAMADGSENKEENDFEV